MIGGWFHRRWHRHRMVRVSSPRVWWVRLLRRPVFHCTDLARVDRSPYPYCPCENPEHARDVLLDDEQCWTMSTVSILHRWCGFTLFYRTWTGAPDERDDERARRVR